MYIVHLGFSGFPTGNATIQRIRFTFKAVKSAGFTPIIINKQNVQEKIVYKKKVNRFDGMIFIYTSPIRLITDSFIKRNIYKITSRFKEFTFLYKRRKKINSGILYTQYFSDIIYYRIISKFLRFRLVIQYVEYRSAIPERNSFFTKINDKLFDNYCYRFCDGVIVISEFLKDAILKKNSQLPVVKIPAICDFNDFKIIPPANPDFAYFLYCGTISYMPVIHFVLTIFEKVKEQQIFAGKLMCILGGNDSSSFAAIEEIFKKSKYRDDIVLYKNLSYNTIIPLYKSADLLLIPLRNSIQDIARFPHKVSEYTASGRPIISSNIGELKYYFIDKESALLVDKYDIDLYVEKVKQIKTNNISFGEIGNKGYEVGYNNFHYESNVDKIKIFFNSYKHIKNSIRK